MRLLSAIPGLLFGLMFAGGGVFFLSQTAFQLWQDWSAMQDWQSVQARIDKLSGSEKEIKVLYHYEVDGMAYQGDRVYVAEMSDNIGAYHNELLKKLRVYYVRKEAVPIWVNPLDPQQAVIDRDMRWGLFAFMSGFCSIFIIIGLLVAYASLRGGKLKSRSKFRRPSLLALRREWKQKQQNPNFDHGFLEFVRYRVEELSQAARGKTETSRWQARKGWETSSIRSNALASMKFIWVFAIFWNVFSLTIALITLPRELEKGNYAALAILLFVAVGAFLLYLAMKPTLEYRRFGQVLFEMDPYPGAIGGNVGGHLRVARLNYATAVEPGSLLLVRLECVYTYMTGSGKERKRSETIKWAEEGKPQIENIGQGVKLAFRFDPPADLPEADVEQDDAYYFWRLTVTAKIRGVDLDRKYNIPVFKTGETSRFVRHDISEAVAERKQQQSDAVKASIARGDFNIPGLTRAMRFSQQGNEMNLVFPMFRNKVLIVFASIFAVGFGFASIMITRDAADQDVFGFFNALFVLPFILVAVLASIGAIYLMFNNLHVHINSDGVSILRCLLFIPIVQRQLTKSDISYLSIKRTGSTGQGVNMVEHFKVVLHDKARKTVTIAEDIDGKDVAGHFRDYLAQRLNVEVRD